MLRACLTAALLTTGAAVASAAPAPRLALDHSNASLIDKSAALELWKANESPRLTKIYPVAKWGFVSEVEGGFDESRACIVTARAMMLPRSGRTLAFQPAKTTTAFGMQAGASMEQCRSLAKAKLEESIGALRAALLPR